MIKYLENIMCKIRKYEEFCNEEINIKKTLAGIALGAGLAFGNPSVGNTQKQINKTTQTTQNKKVILTDVVGWGKVKWGMTSDQVKSIYGNSQKIDTFDIGAFKEVNKKFNAFFKYKDNKLSSVELFIQNETKSYDLNTFDVFLQELESMLFEKYGKVDYKNVIDNYNKIQSIDGKAMIYKSISNWNKKSGNIQLEYTIDNKQSVWYVLNKDVKDLDDMQTVYKQVKKLTNDQILKNTIDVTKIVTIKIIYSDKNNLENL